ncbi:rhoptry neck protein ron2 [Cystoisospora suis]|uniref:Rhoptry neck protein ron2 n=1 Tax=Cystoisospora suis TaxID=483139 RepID=A0A2C6LDY6_9APIC|nr:rhoptry neck protein ron2 [Cystoisospora suis]
MTLPAGANVSTQIYSGAGPVQTVTVEGGTTIVPQTIETASVSQISFGWVPEETIPSLGERNLIEIKKMLRDEGLIEAIRVRAAGKNCPVRMLSNLRELRTYFRETLEEENLMRSNPGKQFQVAQSYVKIVGPPGHVGSRPSFAGASVEFSMLQTKRQFIPKGYRPRGKIVRRSPPPPSPSPSSSSSSSNATPPSTPPSAPDAAAPSETGAPGGDTAQDLPVPDAAGPLPSLSQGDLFPAPERPAIPRARAYVPPPPPRPLASPAEEEQRRPGGATTKRLVGSQLSLYLDCKLASLLGHPSLFLNPYYSERQLLAAIAQALGLSPPTDLSEDEGEESFSASSPAQRQYNGSAEQILGTLEIFRMASNPFTAASSDAGFDMLDEMCDNERGPKRRRSHQTWFQRGASRKHRNKDMPPTQRHLCDALEILLNGIQQTHTDVIEELQKYKIPVEPLVDPATNSGRIQTRICRGMAPVCSYEDSILYPVRALAEHEQKENLKTKKAFNILTGYGSGQVGAIRGQVAFAPFLRTWSSQWGDLLADPSAYAEILERSLWYDTREFMAKTKGFFFKRYDDLVKSKTTFGVLGGTSSGLRVSEIREKLQKYVSARQAYLGEVRASRFKRAIPEQDPEAFNMAIFLYLNGSTSCAQRGSYLSNLRQFVSQQYTKMSAGRNLPASQRSLMAFMRTGQVKFYHDWCNFDPLAINNLFLFRFALSGPDPAALNDKQHIRVSRSKRALKILQSKWAPTTLKKLMKGFNHKQMATEAKHLLLRSLDPSALSGILTAFDFITHTQANLAVNQNSSMYHSLDERPPSIKTPTEKARHYLHKEGVARHTDTLIKNWAEHGIPEDLKRRLSKGEKLPANTTFGNIPIPDLTQWDSQLNTKWVDAYDSYLKHPYGRAALEAHDPIAMLIKDSRDRLLAESEGTIFLGRIASRVHGKKGLLRRAGRAIKSFVMSLLRMNEQSEYAVWFGVKIDIKQVIQICRAINHVAEVVKNDRLYQFITDGWVEIVKDVVATHTRAYTRIPGYDTISAADAQVRKSGREAAIERNQGFITIHHDYAYLSDEERRKEFQLSMCMDHCEALWKLVLSFVLPNLQNPGKLKGYEKDFASNKEIERLNDRHHVNTFRFSLSVQVDFFDNILDKTSKKHLHQMKYGAATWFANAMKLAGQVNTAMGNPHLGTSLYMQAPYYGNYIKDWMEQRRKARLQAILGMLTLGTISLYSLLSVTDIVQHMEDIGAAPPVSCVNNELLGTSCAPQAIAEATTNAAKVATQDVLKVGLFAGIAPYMMLPMVVVSVWNILKSEIKVLLQFEMAVKHVFTRLGRWLSKPFKNWWEKRGRLKDSLLKRASQTFKKTQEETRRTPEPRDLHNASSWGDSELDSLGVPSEPFIQEFEIAYTTPVYPLSAPLIRAAAS